MPSTPLLHARVAYIFNICIPLPFFSNEVNNCWPSQWMENRAHADSIYASATAEHVTYTSNLAVLRLGISTSNTFNRLSAVRFVRTGAGSRMTSEDQSLSSLTSLSHTFAGSTPVKDHSSRQSSSQSGESGRIAGKVYHGTSSVSSEGSRKSAFAKFSRKDNKVGVQIQDPTHRDSVSLQPGDFLRTQYASRKLLRSVARTLRLPRIQYASRKLLRNVARTLRLLRTQYAFRKILRYTARTPHPQHHPHYCAGPMSTLRYAFPKHL